MAEVQPRLFEWRMQERRADTFFPAPCNREALALVQRWRDWPAGVAVIHGSRHSGRTHLGSAWADGVGALAWQPAPGGPAASEAFAVSSGRLFVDDADQVLDEAALIGVMDLVRSRRGAVLLVGGAAPAQWTCRLPDLSSRIRAAPCAALSEPDQTLMEVLLRRACRDRFLELTPEAARFLAARLERSYAAVYAMAERLDAACTQGSRPISALLASRVLAGSPGEPVDWESLDDGPALFARFSGDG